LFTPHCHHTIEIWRYIAIFAAFTAYKFDFFRKNIHIKTLQLHDFSYSLSKFNHKISCAGILDEQQ